MPIDPADLSGPETARSAIAPSHRVIAWSSFLLALLQSICGAVVALSGLRLAIGVGSLVLSATTTSRLVRFHAAAIRIPMLAIALVGAVFTLAVLIHIRQLRRRPSSQWRLKPLTSSQKRMNRLQAIASVTTLVLILIEELLHFHLHHSL